MTLTQHDKMLIGAVGISGRTVSSDGLTRDKGSIYVFLATRALIDWPFLHFPRMTIFVS